MSPSDGEEARIELNGHSVEGGVSKRHDPRFNQIAGLTPVPVEALSVVQERVELGRDCGPCTRTVGRGIGLPVAQ
jgi:hypothetical protein